VKIKKVRLHVVAPALREEAITGKVSDFPTLALSRSGGTGISQPSRGRAPRVKSHIKQIVKLYGYIFNKYNRDDNLSARGLYFPAEDNPPPPLFRNHGLEYRISPGLKCFPVHYRFAIELRLFLFPYDTGLQSKDNVISLRKKHNYMF
jgi:hypothetical protein